MKGAPIFVAGIIVGALCLYAWQGYQFQRITMGLPISQVSLEHASERKAFTVNYGKPLRISMVDLDQAFTLTLDRLADGNIGYSWRSIADETSSGGGVLFEKYEEVAKTPAGRHVKDVGSSLIIDLDGVSLKWSSGSESSGYIYYNPHKISLAYQTKD